MRIRVDERARVAAALKATTPPPKLRAFGVCAAAVHLSGVITCASRLMPAPAVDAGMLWRSRDAVAQLLVTFDHNLKHQGLRQTCQLGQLRC